MDINIVIDCAWSDIRHVTYDFNNDKVYTYVNQKYDNADFVIDLSERIFSPLATLYHPSKRIFVAGEPTFIMGLDSNKVNKMNEFYQAGIFGWHKNFRNLKQFRLFNYGESFTHNPLLKPNKKTFGVSGLFSSKNNNNADGYKLRHEIIGKQYNIKIPSIVYNYTGKWKDVNFSYPLSNKDPSFEWMFHLAIENIREEDYFTEKLIDCFRMFSIPLYFGDPLISNKFNPKGIIILEEKKWLEQINSLTEEDYFSRLQYAEENRKLSDNYININKRIAFKCLQIKKENKHSK